MNEEIKAQWLAALRGGEYTQGKAHLNIQRYGQATYCCLGVLCDLAVKAGVVSADEWDQDITSYGEEEATNMLPREVVEWSGIGDQAGTFTKYVAADKYNIDHDLGYLTLWELNDAAEFTFNQIADVIEEQF